MATSGWAILALFLLVNLSWAAFIRSKDDGKKDAHG
jgi:hypothetical protein